MMASKEQTNEQSNNKNDNQFFFFGQRKESIPLVCVCRLYNKMCNTVLLVLFIVNLHFF